MKHAEPPNEGHKLVVELDVPDGVSDEELYDTVGELAVRIDTLHRALGGRGVTIETVEITSRVALGTQR